eukprot:6173004-Pleurochrysis_carterae.AAC.2
MNLKRHRIDSDFLVSRELQLKWNGIHHRKFSPATDVEQCYTLHSDRCGGKRKSYLPHTHRAGAQSKLTQDIPITLKGFKTLHKAAVCRPTANIQKLEEKDKMLERLELRDKAAHLKQPLV